MSNGQVNGLDLIAATINNQIVVEIAQKDVDGRVARWRPDVVRYNAPLFPIFSADFNARPNGNLADGVDFIHHQITGTYNQVRDGVVISPSPGNYAMDIINRRFTSWSNYLRLKIKSPTNTPQSIRLQHRGGNRPLTSQPGYQWLTAPFQFFDNKDAGGGLSVFRQGWAPNPALAQFDMYALGDKDEWRVGDEVMVLQQGRDIVWYLNGQEKYFYTIATEHWTPGYFASILLDYGHIIDNLEIGHWRHNEWIQLGDNFKVNKIPVLWNTFGNPAVVADDAAMLDPASITANNTYYSYNFSKEPIPDPDQFIRAVVKRPNGVTMSNTLGAMLIGRSGGAFNDTVPYVTLLATTTNGFQISTVVNGAATSRKVETPANVGTLTWPHEIELQCIGNRYYGLVDGNPVIEWIDTTNIVPVSAARGYYGWMVCMQRSSSVNSFGPVIDSIKGLTHRVVTPKAPKLLSISPAVLPLGGGEISVLGEGLESITSLTVGGIAASRLLPRHSDNINQFTSPVKAAGTYDVIWTSPRGDSVMASAVQYLAPVPRGKYDPVTTVIDPINTLVKVPLVPENGFTSPTTNGVVTGMPRGYYRFRAVFTLAYFRSYLRYRLVIPAGGLGQYGGAASVGTVDNLTYFSVGDNATMELQFLRNEATSRTVDNTFDFELVLLSTTNLPAWLVKNNTQLLGATANVFEKITGWVTYVDYASTTNLVNNEIVVPETGSYTIDWQVGLTTANASNTARVVNQAGTVLATKTSIHVQGSQVVTLTKGDSLRLEVSLASTSTTAARTVTTATLLRIVPVI